MIPSHLIPTPFLAFLSSNLLYTRLCLLVPHALKITIHATYAHGYLMTLQFRDIEDLTDFVGMEGGDYVNLRIHATSTRRAKPTVQKSLGIARMAYCVIQGREQIGIFVERGLQSKLPHLDNLLPENNAHG